LPEVPDDEQYIAKDREVHLLHYVSVVVVRDVTKFEFDDVRTSKFSANSELDECFKRFVVECQFVEKSLFHD